MTDEEIIKDDTEILENELANLTAFIQTMEAKAKEIRIALARTRAIGSYVPGKTDLWGFTEEDFDQWITRQNHCIAEARQKGIEV